MLAARDCFARLGYRNYKQGLELDVKISAGTPRVAAFLADAWTVDTKYTRWIVQPIKLVAFVIAVVVDQFAIDGLVNAAGASARGIGTRWRRMADGNIATYGLWMGAVGSIE